MQRVETITTSKLPPDERLAFWNEQAGAKIAPVAVSSAGESRFNATLNARHFHNFSLMSVRCSAVTVASQVRPFDRGMINLVLQKHGHGLHETQGQSADLAPGDLVLLDPEVPMNIALTDKSELLILRVPVIEVEDRMPYLRRMVGRKVCGTAAGGGIVGNFVANMWDRLVQDDEGDWVEYVDDAIWPLISMAYASDISSLQKEAGQAAERKRAMLEIVERNLRDPNLDLAVIADLMGVSVRYIQILFARLGTTASAFIRNRRLDLAFDLLKFGSTELSITDVAYEVGFNDLSTFCRTFRKRFDQSPSQMRSKA